MFTYEHLKLWCTKLNAKYNLKYTFTLGPKLYYDNLLSEDFLLVFPFYLWVATS